MQTRVLVEKSDLSPAFAKDDRIFLGEGLFETLKVDSAKPCFADLHWQRLKYSASQLGIPFDLSLDDWLHHLIEQIKYDNLYHGGIKAILSGGSAPRGLAERGQVSLLMLQSFNYIIPTSPLRLISAGWLRDRANPVYQLKSTNYLEAISARRNALAKGVDDALFFNTQHHATETTCANFFIIKNHEIITPPLVDGVLPGITRSRIRSLCTQQHISFVEQSVSQSMIAEADVAFVSNTLQGIRPVASVDDCVFEVDHPLVQQLIGAL